MKTIILYLFLISSFGIFAQDISKTVFDNSEWFANVNAKNLFKSDTLFLHTIINLEPEQYSDMSSFIKMNYLKTNLFSALKFTKSKIFIDDVDKELCGFSFTDQFNWQFDNETKLLKFYKKENLIAEYIIIS